MSLENTHFGPEQIKAFVKERNNIFFVGIGGINMSSLAHISSTRGMKTGGSDRTKTSLTERLEGEGIEIFYSHDANNLENYDLLVYTVAISADNPEYKEAQKRGIPCISRADYMGYLMSEYTVRVGVSGMHGKSSCTSMCAEGLVKAGKDPTVLSGAELSSMGGAYRIGGEKFFLFEACEYMDSFLDFAPTVSVILNIELDHVDYFKDLEHIKRSYRSFAEIGSSCIANADDENVREALEGYKKEKILFGIENEDADYRAVNIKKGVRGYSFDIAFKNKFLCHVALNIFGYHNIYNSLATAAVMNLCGALPEDISAALGEFRGADRRMEYKGSCNGADVYEDYGHHPTEIASTLSGIKDCVKGELVCVFQSHTYSRTAALFDDFAKALSVADRVFISDIYSARETDTMGVTPEGLAERIGAKASAVHSFKDGAQALADTLREGDVGVVMGAGDIYKVFDYLKLD